MTESNIPADLLYTESDEWVKLDGNIATAGITDFAQHQLGDIVQFELPEVGATVKKGDPVGTVESVKAVADFNAPVSGTVTEVNTSLAGDSPDLDAIKSDAYSAWFVKIEVSDESEKGKLLSADAYKSKISE